VQFSESADIYIDVSLWRMMVAGRDAVQAVGSVGSPRGM
jgi:hypothetical protein